MIDSRRLHSYEVPHGVLAWLPSPSDGLMHMHWGRGGTCFLGEPIYFSRFWNGGDLPESTALHLRVAPCRRSKKPPSQGAAFPPLAGGQGNYRGRGRQNGRAVRGLEDGGWDGARGRTEQAYRNGTGREKERGRGAAAGPTVKGRRKGGRISTQQKRRSPVCLCGVSCAFACRRPTLLGKTSKEGRTQRRTR